MTIEKPSRISAQGRVLDMSPTAFSELRRSNDAVDDAAELRRRLAADGYLFLPGYLDRHEVLTARADVLRRLAEIGVTEPGTDPHDAVPAGQGRPGRVLAEVAAATPSLMRLLYGGRMIKLYERLFGQAVRHFDYTWLRAFPPGRASPSHMDSVFMNRGTLKLLTAWTPLGEIDRTLGGLAILAGSHRLDHIKNDYGMRDVDTYCDNLPGADAMAEHDGLLWDGALAADPVELRANLGLRWLTADYRAGDLLTFTIFTVHMGLDNNAERLRLSTDSRYQPASEPADPRWVGLNPSRHGAGSKRSTIC